MGKATFPALAALLFAACGGTTGPPPPKPDASLPDPCTEIEEMYSDLGERTGIATLVPVDDIEPDGPKVLTLQIPINEDPEPDVLFIEMWETEEPFLSQGFVPLTQSLGGDQADLVTCGACTFIAQNYSGQGPIDHNMAYSGTLTLESVDTTPGTGSVVGTLADVKFREVLFSGEGQEVVEDGCRSELEGVRFSFTIAEADEKKK